MVDSDTRRIDYGCIDCAWYVVGDREMSDERMREAFELYAKDNGFNIDKDGMGIYTYRQVRDLWDSWRTATASMQAEQNAAIADVRFSWANW